MTAWSCAHCTDHVHTIAKHTWKKQTYKGQISGKYPRWLTVGLQTDRQTVWQVNHEQKLGNHTASVITVGIPSACWIWIGLGLLLACQNVIIILVTPTHHSLQHQGFYSPLAAPRNSPFFFCLCCVLFEISKVPSMLIYFFFVWCCCVDVVCVIYVVVDCGIAPHYFNVGMMDLWPFDVFWRWYMCCVLRLLCPVHVSLCCFMWYFDMCINFARDNMCRCCDIMCMCDFVLCEIFVRGRVLWWDVWVVCVSCWCLSFQYVSVCVCVVLCVCVDVLVVLCSYVMCVSMLVHQ